MTSPTPPSNAAHKGPAADWDQLAGQMDKIKENFEHYGKFGDRNFTGDNITLKNADKWLKEAQVTGKTITTTDTSIAFKQVVGNNAKAMTMEQFKEFLWKLAQRESKDDPQGKLSTIIGKLGKKSEPSTANATHAPKSDDVVNRLTDVSKYTGSHKERFDQTTGKGKGKDGRVDPPDTGYVKGYKEKDTYDEKHPPAAGAEGGGDAEK